MDGHAVYDADYVAVCLSALEETGAAGVGGAMITRPRNPTRVGRAIAGIISSPFGVGG